MARYMKAPLDLTVEQLNIYTLLYKKADFTSWEADYTFEQLVTDSHSKLGITKRIAMRIIDDFIKFGYVEVVRKGTRGNSTIYRLLTDNIFNEQRTEYVPNMYQISTECVPNEQVVSTNVEVIGTEYVPNAYQISTVSVPPIIKTETEIIKNMYVFEHWQSKKIHVHKELSNAIKKQIEKLTKKQAEEVISAIDNYSTAYFDTSYYYNNKWTLDTFIKQSNGYSQWTEEGKLWIDYESKRVKTDQQSLFKPGMTLDEKLLANAYRER